MTTTFEGFGLPEALATCLARMNFTTPTPIQAKSIPFALEGRDILGSAQTGTGKTAAFCIPMIAHLMNDPRASAMVMTPTRELAMQVLDVARQMIARDANIRTALLIGGEPMGKQFKQLNDRPRLIVGTPGRMNDHLRRNPDLFEDTNLIVLDEADRMLDMGFSVQIDTILAAAPAERQTLMFSATFAPKIQKFARTYLNNPQRVEIESAKVSAENISHQVIQTSQDGKYDTLRAELEIRMGSVIIFVKTKHGADKLAGKLRNDGHDSASLHGGLNQRQRERATRAFRKMENRILVATDVAARGLDIPHVEHVINYDMPMVAEDYVHRIGRTARAGAKGNALAIVSPSDRGLWMDVERVLNPGAPRAPRSRDEEGGSRKPFRKGPFGKKPGFKKEGFKKDGFKKDGFKKNDFKKRDQEQTFEKKFDRKKERPQREEYFERADRPRSEGFKKREDGERDYANRTSFNKRHRMPEGQDGFRKREDGSRYERPERNERPAFNADRPRGARPEGQKFGKKPFAGKDGKKFGGKPGSKPFAKTSDRGDKPQARRGAARYENAGKPAFKSGFKKSRTA